ncbi:MAG: DUF1508 domain-containing protein [Rhodobacteraceae bacterium]|nr:DUF1508 domain-containing protein [Paracoccaceae bacterium]
MFAALTLARSGLSLLKAKRAVEKMLAQGEVALILPHVESTKSLVRSLKDAGISVAIVTPPQRLSVKELRTRLRLTQEQFAVYYGVDLRTLQNYESNVRTPDRTTLGYFQRIEAQPKIMQAHRLLHGNQTAAYQSASASKARIIGSNPSIKVAKSAESDVNYSGYGSVGSRRYKMAGKFELYKDKAGEFRFRLKAGNGEIILASEGYKRRASAMNGIESVRRNSATEARFEKKTTKAGNEMFNLKATNGQVVGTSESYSSASARDNGIASVMKNAPDARLEDLT